MSSKFRIKGYNRGYVIDITDMDSQLICRVYNYNGKAEALAEKICELLKNDYNFD